MPAKRSRVSTPTAVGSESFPSLDLPILPPYPPMEAKRNEKIPSGEDWLFEPKWDGFRAIAFRDGDTVVLQSKAGQPLTRYFPEIADELRRLDSPKFILDGEIVVQIDDRLSFDDLLQRIHPAASRIKRLAAETPGQYFVFDLLHSGDETLAGRPLSERREALEGFFRDVVPNESSIRLSPATTDRGIADDWFENFGSAGLDGIMAKRLGEHYHSGDRDAMIKVKHLKSADCVVGGFRYATGSKSIGSLLLGLYDDDGNLVFIGHTSSFNKDEKNALREIVEPLRAENPFSVRVPGGPSRWSTEKSGEWEAIAPSLVCEVEYDYFSQNRFRHGSKFLRWRAEKDPKSCVMGQVLPTSPSKGKLKKLGG